MVAATESARARGRAPLPGAAGGYADPLGDDPGAVAIGGQHGDLSVPGRAGAGRRAPHECAGPLPGLLGMALRMAPGGRRPGGPARGHDAGPWSPAATRLKPPR